VDLSSLDSHNTWQEFTQHTLPQRTTTSHLTIPGLPELRVTDSADQFTQPHASSFDNLYQPSIHQPQAPHHSLNINNNARNFEPSYNMENAADTTSIHTLQGPRHERTPSTNSNSNIPTPVSMSGFRSPLLSDDHHHRRPSIAASVASSYGGHRRERSEGTSSEDCEDGGSPRRNHAYKRSEEPPRSHDGKMTCKYKECANTTFDRKCEWR
jgi:hypothetical protein